VSREAEDTQDAEHGGHVEPRAILREAAASNVVKTESRQEAHDARRDRAAGERKRVIRDVRSRQAISPWAEPFEFAGPRHPSQIPLS
jgi:hypothetical protein